MDKRIEKIINPPFLESIRRMEKQMSIAALALQETDAMRSIGKLSENTRIASLALNQTELMKNARIAAESTKLASLAFQQSEAMESIRRFSESNQLAMLALQESGAMKSLRAAAESTRIATMAFQNSGAFKQLQDIAKTSQLASIALKQSEAFNQISQLSKLASFKALYNLDNSPFTESAALAFALQSVDTEISDESLIDIDAKIREEISSNTDFNALSENTKRILLYLYHYYFLPVFLSCLSAYMMTNAVEARKELQSISTPSEVRSFARASHQKFDRSSLKGFRITTVHALNLREEPSMKSEVITTLPIGTLAEVIDKTHRAWILVEVEIDGQLEQGWISRRYATYFK